MTWTVARATLDGRMATLSIGTAKIAWPNMPLAAQTALYYQVDFLPATVAPEIGGPAHEGGIYQVTVCAPAGAGLGDALTKAQAVSDHFNRQRLGSIFTGVPTLGPPLQEPNWLRIPVSIPFAHL